MFGCCQVCLLASQIPRFDRQYPWKEIIDTFFWSSWIFFLLYFLAFFTKYNQLRFNCDMLNRNSLFVIIMFFFKHNKMSAKKKVFNLVIHIFVGDIQMTTSWRIWQTIQLGMWWSWQVTIPLVLSSKFYCHWISIWIFVLLQAVRKSSRILFFSVLL